MSQEEQIKCTGCRWNYIDSNEKINCTCPSQELAIIDEDDDLTIQKVKECHQYVPLDDNEYFDNDYDRNQDDNPIGEQYKMMWDD